MGSWQHNPDLLFLLGTQHGTRPDMKTDVTMTRSSDKTPGCTQGSCSCQSYQPGQLRTCLDCRHGWVFHALDKLQAPAQAVCGGAQAEVVVPGVVFDLSSLVLFGAQAVPVRMKILLDRLLSVLPPQQVLNTLLPLGWSLRDYIRGYMLQDSTGRVLDRWLMISQEEEAVILPHFLRFGETRPIVELMMQQDFQANRIAPSGVRPAPPPQSNLRAFIQNSPRNPPPSSRTHGTLSQLQNSGGSSKSLRPSESSALSWLLPLQLPSPSLLLDLTPPITLGRVIRLGGDQNQGEDPGSSAGPGTGSSSGSVCVPVSSSGSVPVPGSSSESVPVPGFGFRPVSLTQNNSRNSCLKDLRTPSLSSLSTSPLSTSPPSTHPPRLSSLPPAPSSSHLSLGARKGRVSCTACGKSFYDKGTLKIHVSAVHLQVKHSCTVPGCSMKFSSLRSRNRHSANPNPRLHTHTPRDTHSYPNTHRDAHRNVRMYTHSSTHTHVDTNTVQGKVTHIHANNTGEPRSDTQRHNSHTLQQHTNTQQHHTQPAPLPPLSTSMSDHLSPPLLPRPEHLSLGQPAPLHPLSTSMSDHLSPPLLPRPEHLSLGQPAPLHPLSTSRPEFPPCDGTPSFLFAPSTSVSTVTNGNQSHKAFGSEGGACAPQPANQKGRCASGDPKSKKKPRKSSTPVKITMTTVEARL